jgi:hypothetical protein
MGACQMTNAAHFHREVVQSSKLADKTPLSSTQEQGRMTTV